MVIEAGTSLTIKGRRQLCACRTQRRDDFWPHGEDHFGRINGSGSGSSPKTPKDAAAAHSSGAARDAP